MCLELMLAVFVQVVKCRVLSTDISHQRLKLSLTGKKSSAEGEDAQEGDPLGGLQPGDVVRGTVREIETAQVTAQERLPWSLASAIPWQQSLAQPALAINHVS